MINHKVRIDNVQYASNSGLMKAQFFGASGHFIFSEQYIADWTANSDATTWCIQCMKMLRERWTMQTAWYNSILLIMKYFAYRYIPLLPNVRYMQYIQYMHVLMLSCNNNLYTCGEILDLSQNSVDFAPSGSVMLY